MKIKLIDGSYCELDTEQPVLKKHFADPYNYTKEIIAQFDQDYYQDIVTPEDKVIVDIGANVGLFSLHVSPYAEHLVCVEPTPEHFEKLSAAVSWSFKNVGMVGLINKALSDHDGSTDFHWCGINTTMNSLQPRGDRKMVVECLTLGKLLDDLGEKVDLLKIDIEGSEHTALTNETLSGINLRERVKKIFIELHPPDSVTQEKFKALFESLGYTVTPMFHDSLLCT